MPRRAILAALLLVLLGAACSRAPFNPATGAPPPLKLDSTPSSDIYTAPGAGRFALATAVEHTGTTSLAVTGEVTFDVNRTVPVVSLASGRVVGLRVRLGDTVRRGQLLFQIASPDVSDAFSTLRQAEADNTLAQSQFARARDLQTHGALSMSDLQIAQDAAAKAQAALDAASSHVRLLGADPADPAGTLDVVAPASGVIVEQNINPAGGVKTLDNSPNLLTIADLSTVWVMCDVYENDLSQVRLGAPADIRLVAFPNRPLTGRIDNIGAVLDPSLRTAKVRIAVVNPGFLRVGMFATATFHGQAERHTAVPARAIVHLHDQDWVYEPLGGGRFRRVAVVVGVMLPGDMQEVVSGLAPGQSVVADALAMESTVQP